MATIASGSVVSVDPEYLGGAPRFRGTRVPVRTLFDYLAGGDTIEDFIEGFPPITREMVARVLDEAGDALVERYLAPAP